MNSAQLDLAFPNHPRNSGALLARKGKIEPASHAPFKEIEVLGQRQGRDHQMKAMDALRIEGGEVPGEKVRLLLVVSLEADAIARLDDRFEQRVEAIRRHDFRGETLVRRALETRVLILLFDSPRRSRHGGSFLSQPN